MSPILSNYSYFYIVCEGTSESDIIDWIQDENRFFSNNINFDYKYSRSTSGKRKLLNKISSTDTGGEVAILYVHDSKREDFLGKNNHIYNIPVINVLTCPEIEVLLILKEPKLRNPWLRNTNRKKPSEVCSKFYKTNVKKSSFLVDQFDSLEDLFEVCKEYKRIHKGTKNQNDLTLYDIIKE